MAQDTRENKFPVFDIVIIILIILGIVGVAYWLTQRNAIQNVEIEYTVRYTNVGNEYSGNFAEGKQLYLESGVSVGKISSVEITRANVTTTNESGIEEQTGSTKYSDVLITVTATAKYELNAYFVEKQRIAAGIELDSMTGGFLGNGLILSVKEASND